jgi:hypothetical protein
LRSCIIVRNDIAESNAFPPFDVIPKRGKAAVESREKGGILRRSSGVEGLWILGFMDVGGNAVIVGGGEGGVIIVGAFFFANYATFIILGGCGSTIAAVLLIIRCIVFTVYGHE